MPNVTVQFLSQQDFLTCVKTIFFFLSFLNFLPELLFSICSSHLCKPFINIHSGAPSHFPHPCGIFNSYLVASPYVPLLLLKNTRVSAAMSALFHLPGTFFLHHLQPLYSREVKYYYDPLVASPFLTTVFKGWRYFLKSPFVTSPPHIHTLLSH